jgi:tyrosyl-tRNA synthetase
MRPAIDIVNKTMKIGDELTWRWIDLLSFDISLAEAAQLKRDVEAGQLNPRDLKLRLAHELAMRFHSRDAADAAIHAWTAVVRGDMSNAQALELKEIAVPSEGIKLPQLLKQSGLLASTSEAIRKIGERGVRIDGEVVENKDAMFQSGASFILQVGKRSFLRVSLR